MTAVRRLATRLAPEALVHVRRGHPWVFDGSVRSVKGDGRSGDLAVIFDDHNRFAAIGLYDPRSPIRIKVLHAGAPVPIDDAFWDGRVAAALERRASIDTNVTTGYRLVHGENDGLPGLVADRYGPVVVVKLYSAAWFAHVDAVVAPLLQRSGATTAVLRLSRRVAADDPARAEGEEWGEPLVDPVVPFLENGLRFEADVRRGQKSGTFLDQRDNRARVRRRSHRRRVLDVFCCNGGFSVHAAAGGASLVHSIDLSPDAVASVARNVAANRDVAAVRACRFESTAGDALEVMRRQSAAGRRYDLVVVDPPSFASRADQAERALDSYARLTRAAVELLDSGGTLVQSSCSSRVAAEPFFAAIRNAASSSGVELRDELTTGHAIDHPIGFSEGAYLKAMFATVHRGR